LLTVELGLALNLNLFSIFLAEKSAIALVFVPPRTIHPQLLARDLVLKGEDRFRGFFNHRPRAADEQPVKCNGDKNRRK
jgi:hypothetical protein